jgi:hypothetical protein
MILSSRPLGLGTRSHQLFRRSTISAVTDADYMDQALREAEDAFARGDGCDEPASRVLFTRFFRSLLG